MVCVNATRGDQLQRDAAAPDQVQRPAGQPLHGEECAMIRRCWLQRLIVAALFLVSLLAGVNQRWADAVIVDTIRLPAHSYSAWVCTNPATRSSSLTTTAGICRSSIRTRIKRWEPFRSAVQRSSWL